MTFVLTVRFPTILESSVVRNYVNMAIKKYQKLCVETNKADNFALIGEKEPIFPAARGQVFLMSKLIAPPTDLNPIDREMPDVPAGELLCDGCWAVSSGDRSCWMSFNFKHLKQTNLCPECVHKEAPRLAELQRQGM